MPRAERLAAALLTVLVAGCPPTLSRPRGEGHLDALAAGIRHMHAGRHGEAEAAFARAAATAERRVDRDEATYMQARARRRAGDVAGALALLDEIAERRPVSRRTVRALYDASRLRIGTDEHARGVAGFVEVYEAYPSHGLASRAFRQVVLDFEARGDDDGALAFMRERYPAVRDSLMGDNLLWAEAQILLRLERTAEAEEVLERLVRDHPYPQGHYWDDALWALADMDEARGEHERAIERLGAILQRYETTSMVGSYTLPTMPRASLRIARIYRDGLHDPARAEAQLRRFRRRFPHSTLRDDALLEIGELRLASGDREGGCAILREVVEEYEVGRARRSAQRRLDGECADRR